MLYHPESIYRRYIYQIDPDSECSGECYWFCFSHGDMLVCADGLHVPLLGSPEDAGISPLRKQYLGLLDGKPCFSAELPPEVKAPDGMQFMNIRATHGFLDEDIYLIAGKAVQIVNWDESHQFCGRCGHPTEYVRGERAKKCPVCGFMSFPRLSPATITAVLKGKQLLLTQYASFMGPMRTIVAGFVEPGETLEECVHREVFEETGIKVKNPRYLGSQPWPFPNSLMIGFIADYESGEIHVDGKEIAGADWFDLDKLPDLPPELSIARKIIDWVVKNYS